MYPKEILNKIKWTGNPELQGITIWILHRGAPADIKVVDGGQISKLEHSFFVVSSPGKETRIPYHRIQKILLAKEIIYDRKEFVRKSQ